LESGGLANALFGKNRQIKLKVKRRKDVRCSVYQLLETSQRLLAKSINARKARINGWELEGKYKGTSEQVSG